MATSCTDFDHPYYKEIENKNDRQRYEFFTEDNAKRMKFVSLGEGFDFISHGGGNYVGYNHTSRAIMSFIKSWIEAQRPKIDYERIELGNNSYTYKETGREHFYLWNKFHLQHDIPELPRINYDVCPLDSNHNELILDRGGRLRCAHQRSLIIKPSFTKLGINEGLGTGTKKYDFYEDEPMQPRSYDENGEEDTDPDDYKEYLEKQAKFDNEEPAIVTDTCYAIVKEPKKMSLPLEIILNRLNCSYDKKYTLYPFSGFTLASFVQAWWEQPGDKKYIGNQTSGIELYKAFPKFTPISTDD
jgi:hypothetical protein